MHAFNVDEIDGSCLFDVETVEKYIYAKMK